jgi:hypothetical protein
MEFRWIALIALWTLVSGPIFGTPRGPGSPAPKAVKASAGKAQVTLPDRAR